MALTKAIGQNAAHPVTIGSGTGWLQGVVVSDSAGNEVFGPSTVIGQVGSPSNLADVTLTLDTLIYAAGDVLSDTAEVVGAARVNGGRAVLESVILIDEDDQGIALDLHFFATNVSLGTKNVAPSISDVNAREHLGAISIVAGDYKDLGGVRVATLRSLGLLLEAAAASTSVWVQAVTQGAPTHTANGIRLKLGLVQG